MMLNDNQVDYELRAISLPEQITTKIANMAFSSEEDALRNLCYMEGPINVRKTQDLLYTIYLPPSDQKDEVRISIKDKVKDILGPTNGPYEVVGGIAKIPYSFLSSGNFTIEVIHPIYRVYLDVSVEYTLKDIQEEKINAMNDICNNTILAGFKSWCTGKEYTYDFDYEAQINLAGMFQSISSGMVSGSIMWKTKEKGPVPHTHEQFKTLFMDGITFKQQIIAKYWHLKQTILNCKTKEEVDLIRW